MTNLTGKQIYDAICEKEKALKEYDATIQQLSINGLDTAPYKTLIVKNNDLAHELDRDLNKVYAEVKEEPIVGEPTPEEPIVEEPAPQEPTPESGGTNE